jgi:hypothetical protein
VVLTGVEDGGAAGNLEVNTGELRVGFQAATAWLALCSRGGGAREAARGSAAGGGRAGPTSPFMGTRARRQRRRRPGRPWRLRTLWPVGPRWALTGPRQGRWRWVGSGWAYGLCLGKAEEGNDAGSPGSTGGLQIDGLEADVG